MEIAREGHSGLYTMHFSNLFPPDPVPSGASEAGSSGVSSSTLPSLTEFSQWHVLIRMSVENDICFVKGDAKVFSPTVSLASPAARGVSRDGEQSARTTLDGIPIVPIHQKDRKCQVLIEGTYRVCDFSDQASAFRLEVHLEHLEAAVLGLPPADPNTPAPDLQDVVLSCGGHKSCGWHMGVVQITSKGERVDTPRPLHFLLKPYYGKRCTHCLDPVYAIGYSCASCEVTHYCSRECLNAHMKRGHGMLCPLLKSRYSTRSGSVATEVSDDTRLVAWWRCMENSYYSILVDHGGTLGCAVEFTLCTLKSAKEEGLQFRFITPVAANSASSSGTGYQGKDGSGNANGAASASPALPSDDEVIDFSCVLFREVNRSAVLEGCASLASACLNYLFIYSPSTEITIQSHLLFFTGFNCEELDVPISTVEEYVSFTRPIHSLAVLQIEYALRSAIATEFWRRIRTARDAVLSLCAVNDCKPCAGVEEMRTIVAQQQCEAMLLLTKIYVIMATRCKEDSQRWLSEGERLLRQCINRDIVKSDSELHATYCFRLAVYLLLFQDEAKNEEAAKLRKEGEQLLKIADAQKRCATLLAGSEKVVERNSDAAAGANSAREGAAATRATPGSESEAAGSS